MLNNTKKILDKYNIRLDKNKSQNYLIDKNKLNKILENADIHNNETILEIGAGIGTLTIPMAKKAKKVIAIEKDPIIADILKQRIIKEKLSNIEVIREDALKIDFPEFDKMVSNLPYQISSPVTFKLLKYPFKKAILMYQLEFAKRMQANPNTHEYSRLSVALYFRADIQIIDTLPPEAFIPKPKVNSAVIELVPKENNVTQLFDNTTRALFQHRNKKAKKALIQSAHELKSNKKELKPKLDNINNPLLDEKVFKLTPENIKEISEIIGEIL
ncbi:16S rRNA (adenine(1518)-N(6)/adenine(1519)-N(6))-dimethyltransferase RsmA [Methanosphaera sp. WGK6]|uniref:16S rRNA (adenine(1518)-N(6)/adenine(1519)-N(6))- dimethyltransferase RsmA n=1 Tax=Methanosphaera sp. WGK6 TaxID=1561964 RepID=UPI00084BC6E9|nr:16S rRNA (adenine(1518)-N(6)/adenine(1519)-N(6))-dimethyltransferase RsmA [Methanosphaera sp. WGK6]OED30769.1 16S rRNA methyltransferase [Methanosphaera sp. WGK6]